MLDQERSDLVKCVAHRRISFVTAAVSAAICSAAATTSHCRIVRVHGSPLSGSFDILSHSRPTSSYCLRPNTLVETSTFIDKPHRVLRHGRAESLWPVARHAWPGLEDRYRSCRARTRSPHRSASYIGRTKSCVVLRRGGKGKRRPCDRRRASNTCIRLNNSRTAIV